MFKIATVETAFLPLVGWRQNPDPAGVQITGLTTSDSGIFMNDVHPLLTFSNLESIAPDFSLFVYPAWDNAKAYVIGNIVLKDSKNYYCVKAHTGQSPPNSEYWKEWNSNEAFTDWLTNKTKGAIAQLFNDWSGRKFEAGSIRSLVEREELYTSTGSNSDTVEKPGDHMSGIELRIIRSRGALATIRKISLHLSESQSLTLYLYKSGNKNPIKTENLNYTQGGDVQWFDVEWELEGKGAYYLCYSQNELAGHAYNDANERTAWSSGWQLPGGKYFRAHPFTAPVMEADGVGADEIENTLIVGGSDVFLTSQIGYIAKTNGLNVAIEVSCDYTEFVVEQKKKFALAFSLFLAKSLLREMAYNPNARVNRNKNNLKREEILYEIDGNPHGISGSYKTGLAAAYEKAIAAVKFDTTGIDELCLPCAEARGVEYGATG